MYPVVIQKQALPDARYQLQLARLPVAIDVERLTRLYTTQHTYQPFLDLFSCRDPARYLFLALSCRGQILHRPLQSLGLCSTRLLQALAHPQHMPAKFRQPHLFGPQITHHPFRIADRPQRPPKYQPVEATQYSRNLFPVFRDKLFHGVSVLRRYGVLAEPPHLIENRSAFYLWLRLCRAVLNLSFQIVLLRFRKQYPQIS